jgi:hypothetical protein
MPNSGTVRKVVINGATYDVPADINITFNRSSFTTEGVATSGRTMYKMTRRVPTMESVVLMTDPSEAEALRAVAESLADATIAVELADGSTYRTSGKINYENWETEENRSAIVIIPSKVKDAWTPFIA